MLGLKLVGRRAFGELGPQDLILIMLLAESMDIGLTPEGLGMIGSLISATVLMGTMAIIDRIPVLRKWLDGSPVVLYRKGELFRKAMKQENISLDDLEKAGREYGYDSIEVFDSIMLEGDGSITCVIRHEFRTDLSRRVNANRVS